MNRQPLDDASDRAPENGHAVLRGIAWAGLIAQAVIAYFAVPWVRADAPDYLRLANDLAHGTFGTTGWPEALRPPGYPLFLCLLHDWMGLPLGVVVALQLAMVLAGVWLIARFLKGGLATAFLWLAAIYPFTALYASAIMAEAVATLCLTAIALLIVEQSWQRLAIAGALAGVLTMFRPDFALLPIVLAAVSFGPSRARAVIPLVAAALVMTPYAIWNDVTFGKLSPVPVAGAVGASLYLSTWQDKVPLESLDALYAQRSTPAAEKAGLTAELKALNARIGAPPLLAPWNPVVYPTLAQERASVPLFFDAAVARIKADPASYARHVVLNLWRLWNSSTYPALAPLLGIISAIMTLLGLAGVVLAVVKPVAPVTRGQALVFLYLPAIHVWLHTEARYTAADRPLLIMFAAMLLMWARDKLLVTHPAGENPLAARFPAPTVVPLVRLERTLRLRNSILSRARLPFRHRGSPPPLACSVGK